MSRIEDGFKITGNIETVIEYSNGDIQIINIPNTILTTGRNALAQCLVNDIGSEFNFYISRMVFGSNGTDGGVPLYVDAGRNGLFGLTVLSKPVIATVNPNVSSQAIFTSVVAYTEANGLVLNEMALQMNNGNLYSMKTFPDLTKSSSMQLTFNWVINLM